MKYEIKELQLGDILDQGIRLLRDKFGLLMGIMGLTVIPFQIGIGYLTQMIQPAPGRPPTVSMDLIFLQLSLVVLFLFVVLPMANAAVMFAAARIYLGQSVSLGECFGHGFRRILPLIWTSFLMGLAIMGGFILLIIPGILCAFWFALAQQVTVLESISGSAALSRSKALMKGNIGTAFVLGLIIAAINFGIGMISNAVPYPVNIIVGGVTGGALTLLSSCTYVVFYFSCRCKLDNFDLEVLAGEVADDSEESLAVDP